MCKILKNIYGQSAEQLLEKYKVSGTVPVDLEKLSLEMGISVLPMNFVDLEKKIDNNGEILGLLLSNSENAVIYYRESDSHQRRRFTIAHEIAHCALHAPSDNEIHIEYRIDEKDKNQREKNADIYAGKLLIPFNMLKKEYLNLEIPASPTLARIFDVSIRVMEARLDYLGVSYFNREGRAVVKPLMK